MQIEYQEQRPCIHEPVDIAPNAVVCGDVTIGANSRVLFGAVLVAEGGPVVIGSHCIIMEELPLPCCHSRPGGNPQRRSVGSD